MIDRLGEILDRKRGELSARRSALASLASRPRPSRAPVDLLEALRQPGPAIIAEIKRRSPSAGALRPGLDPATLAQTLQAAGARALSILTDGAGFGGSLDDLEAVRAATTLPLLRKDFLLDPLELVEARHAGADAALLIAEALPGGALAEAIAAAAELSLTALVEAHSIEEAERCLAAGARLLGINNRDLRTLATDLGACERILPLLRGRALLVAESGLRSAADVRRMRAAGADAVLVGESLLRAEDPARALRELLEGA